MTTVVLIIDDSRPMRELIKMTLAGVAEIVGECSDGSEVLSAFERLRPDSVLMDIEMKNIDGITVTAQITAAHPLAKTMIVTDYNDAEPAACGARRGSHPIHRQRKFAGYCRRSGQSRNAMRKILGPARAGDASE